MNDNPTGLETTIRGLETVAENTNDYRSLLSLLEATIELNNWFSNVGEAYENHQRFKRIEETIIPKITRQPRDLRRDSWTIAKELEENHLHMSIHAAESVVEYWKEEGETTESDPEKEMVA